MINWTPLSNELRGKIRFGPPPPWKSWKKLLSVRFLEGPVRRLEGPVRRLEGPVRFLEGPALFGRSRAFWKVLWKWRIRWSLSDRSRISFMSARFDFCKSWAPLEEEVIFAPPPYHLIIPGLLWLKFPVCRSAVYSKFPVCRSAVSFIFRAEISISESA